MGRGQIPSLLADKLGTEQKCQRYVKMSEEEGIWWSWTSTQLCKPEQLCDGVKAREMRTWHLPGISFVILATAFSLHLPPHYKTGSVTLRQQDN